MDEKAAKEKLKEFEKESAAIKVLADTLHLDEVKKGVDSELNEVREKFQATVAKVKFEEAARLKDTEPKKSATLLEEALALLESPPEGYSEKTALQNEIARLKEEVTGKSAVEEKEKKLKQKIESLLNAAEHAVEDKNEELMRTAFKQAMEAVPPEDTTLRETVHERIHEISTKAEDKNKEEKKGEIEYLLSAAEKLFEEGYYPRMEEKLNMAINIANEIGGEYGDNIWRRAEEMRKKAREKTKKAEPEKEPAKTESVAEKKRAVAQLLRQAQKYAEPEYRQVMENNLKAAEEKAWEIQDIKFRNSTLQKIIDIRNGIDKKPKDIEALLFAAEGLIDEGNIDEAEGVMKKAEEYIEKTGLRKEFKKRLSDLAERMEKKNKSKELEAALTALLEDTVFFSKSKTEELVGLSRIEGTTKKELEKRSPELSEGLNAAKKKVNELVKKAKNDKELIGSIEKKIIARIDSAIEGLAPKVEGSRWKEAWLDQDKFPAPGQMSDDYLNEFKEAYFHKKTILILTELRQHIEKVCAVKEG